MGDGGAEEATCAICFEDITKHLDLPCACKVDYCLRCWDHSMATSLVSSGQCRCPTCRSLVHVSFDADLGHIVFSREEATEDPSGAEAEAAADGPTDARALAYAAAAREQANILRHQRLLNATITRLAQEALPAQVRLLREFGAANPSLMQIAQGQGPPEAISKLPPKQLKSHIQALGSNTDGCLEKSDMIERLKAAAGGSWRSVASYWASLGVDGGDNPKCVCGASFTRVLPEDRAASWLLGVTRLQRGTEEFERALRQVVETAQGGIVCDLCDEQVLARDRPLLAVWTCGTGNQTVLHATSYDVCDSCFVQHAFPEAEQGSAMSQG